MAGRLGPVAVRGKPASLTPRQEQKNLWPVIPRRLPHTREQGVRDTLPGGRIALVRMGGGSITRG